MILIIDNYDSFTWNLVDLVRRQTDAVKVVRNDELELASISTLDPTGILISPGPGVPLDSGISIPTVREFAGKVPILGICMGLQVIGEVFGAHLIHAELPMHGKTTPILHDGKGVFADLPSPFEAMRYHSLVLESENLPDELVQSAWTAGGEIMGVRHRTMALEAVQFHPESILTEGGEQLVGNWLASLG